MGGFFWLAYVVYLVTGAEGDPLGAVLVSGAFGGAFAACIAAARARPARRAPWVLLALAVGAYAQTAICYTLMPEAASSFPSALDVGLFAFYPLMLAAFAAFVRLQMGGFTHGLWIDSLIGAVVAAAVGAAALDPSLDGFDDPAVNQQLPFFLGDLAFLGFLLVAAAVSGWRDVTGLVFLAGGAAMLAVGDGLWLVEVGQGTARPSTVIAAAWPAGLLAFAAGASARTRGVPRTSSAWSKVGVPAAAAAASLPVMFLSPEASLARPLASVALCLIVVRFTIGLVENNRLLEAAQRAAITDPLTGLANRQLLVDRLERALRRQARRRGLVAVLFFDLDDFKAINDSHGHDVGDQVLIAVAERVREALRGEDTVARVPESRAYPAQRDTIARLGGDEFVVILEALQRPEDAAAIAERILDTVRAPLTVGEHEMALDASIGVTVCDEASDRGASEILRDGDTAMYAAKRSGKGSYQLFEPEMHAEVVARSEVVRDLRHAVARGQLKLLYQPQVDVASGRMTGVEALVRWEHPQRGLLTPDRFIPEAERSGLIIGIDDWVVREACRQLRAWDDAGLPPLDMAVNVSARRLTAQDLPRVVEAAIRDAGIAPGRLEIELTETVAVEHNELAVAAIRAVRELGARAAIDDFGMGHSALSRLQSFPVDRIKIDRSFVAPLTVGAERGSIADAMVALGQSLGLDVVAEGVETGHHLQALRTLGCAAAQGFLFSRPVPPGDIEQLSRAGASLAPPDPLDDAPASSAASVDDRLIRNLLAELQRVTGLETTYLTRIDLDEAVQRITHARNTGVLDIPEGLTIDWSETVCRRAIERGINYTDDAGTTFADSPAARELGLQTYVSVPLLGRDGDPEGTLCGGSTARVPLGAETLQVMQRFADMISRGVYGAGTNRV